MDDQTRADANYIEAFLRETVNGVPVGQPIMSNAIFDFVTRSVGRVYTQTKLIPPNALSCVGPGHIAVREQDFIKRDKPDEHDYLDDRPTYDLHDFSHLTAATLCAELYGNK